MPQVELRAKVPTKFLSLPGHERVAVLLGDRYQLVGPRGKETKYIIRRILPVPNVKRGTEEDPTFGMDLNWLMINAGRKEGKIIGVVHSHTPKAPIYPSYRDLKKIPDAWLGAVWHPLYRTLCWYTYDTRMLTTNELGANVVYGNQHRKGSGDGKENSKRTRIQQSSSNH